MTGDSPTTQDATVTFVAQALRLDPERAERAIRATLETLAERIDAGEARDLAASLSPPLAASLHTTTAADGFDADEFLRRAAQREGVDLHTAERHVPIVLEALERAVGEQEYRDMVAELPEDYARLLPRGRAVEVVPVETIVAGVAQRAGVDAAQARTITDAVLEVLAERIDGGEVDDLILHLPLELHEPLRRGLQRSGGQATSMKLDDFVERIAEREGAGPPPATGRAGVGLGSPGGPLVAREHARAVFGALREAIGDEELFDVLSQLPPDYKSALAQ
jgi:uncharacterized protein (DUF2267 family)